MNDESFPEETLLDAAAMFHYLSKQTDLIPEDMELEWVFAVEGSIEFDGHSISPFLESVAEVTDADEDALCAEVHAVDPSEIGSETETSQLLLCYTGMLTQSQLKAIHAALDRTARKLGLEYLGVECGAAGAMERSKVDSFIEWVEGVLDETAQWRINDLTKVAARMRSRHIESAEEKGLDVADWMPTAETRGYTQLRPHAEVVRRLMAAHATVAWVCAPDDVVPSAVIKGYIRKNGLKRNSFSAREAEWIGTSRKDVRDAMPRAGWVTENIWSLAWLLGAAPMVCPSEQPVPQSILMDIRHKFLCSFERGFDELMGASVLQPVELVITLEDFMYCIHNGFRNMQDVERGGLIQERRHALTWALSPGTDWDDTDVST